jgi:hypothetical protein
MSRYYSLNDFFKETFHEKIYKVSLDGGMTCPNRDGKVSRGGCIFCSESGSGDFAGDRRKSITQQIEEQLKLIEKKFPDGKVMAYFQNFTNTYAPVEYLKEIYEEALSHPRVIGLAIGTRPDCIPDDVLELLDELNKKTFLWIELGLQTSNEETAKFINRAYPLSTYIDTTEKLNSKNIKFVTHVIVGLPGDSREDSFNTALLADRCGSWGIKIHSLHILKNTRLEKYYTEANFKIYEKEEYVKLVADILEAINPKMVVHRLTGDGKKEDLIAPLWSLNKRDVLNHIEMELKKRRG